MLNKFVSAAVIGSTALAVAVLPAASTASAVTAPTPVPVSTVPAPTNPTVPTHPTAPTKPAAPTKPSKPTKPGSHPKAPAHHHAPGHHRTKPGKPGTGKPVAGKGKTGTGKSHGGRTHHKPSGKPTSGKPGSGKTGSGKSGTGKSGTGKAGSGKAGKGSTGKPGGSTGAPGTSPVVSAGHHRPTGTPARSGVAVPRIIGGDVASNAPWAAQISWDDKGFECSGAAIGPQWVLTARHCVDPGGMSVLIGSTKLGEGTEAKVDQKQVDPKGDIALLHLAEPVNTTYLPLADEDPKVGSVNEIYGWGMTSEDSGPAQELRTAKVKVTSVDCTDAQKGRAICSTGVNGMAFNGDSGGPEIMDGADVGVCSTGDDSAKSQQYASVAANRDWIREVASV